MDKHIIDFIEKQKTATVCCLDDENSPYCFSVFYTFDKGEKCLYFKSSPSAHHSHYLLNRRKVAGTILPDRLNMLVIRGIQFTGFIVDEPTKQHHATVEYHKHIPLGLAMSGDVLILRLETIKMTDNTIGIGNKINWQREDLYEDVC
jgi:uncharacterized protein YhbP (UPF0306 family)